MAYYPKNFYIKPELPNLDNQKASINSDEAKLRTFPANSMGVASFFGAQQIHQMGENIKALVLGATGETLEADLFVGQGHQHNTQASRLRWLQLATFPFVNSPLDGGDIEDSLCIRSTALTKRALVKLSVIASDAIHVVPRFRVSMSPGPNPPQNCQLLLKYYDLNGALLATTYPVTLTTFRSMDREWVYGQPVDLIAMGANFDVNFPLIINYGVLVSFESIMSANLDFVYVHEMSWGVYDL